MVLKSKHFFLSQVCSSSGSSCHWICLLNPRLCRWPLYVLFTGELKSRFCYFPPSLACLSTSPQSGIYNVVYYYYCCLKMFTSSVPAPSWHDNNCVKIWKICVRVNVAATTQPWRMSQRNCSRLKFEGVRFRKACKIRSVTSYYVISLLVLSQAKNINKRRARTLLF